MQRAGGRCGLALALGVALLATGRVPAAQVVNPHARGTIHEGVFEARGVFGQHVYVNPTERVVIVVWSALPKPTGRATVRDNDFFAAVSRALRQDGNGGRGAEP